MVLIRSRACTPRWAATVATFFMPGVATGIMACSSAGAGSAGASRTAAFSTLAA